MLVFLCRLISCVFMTACCVTSKLSAATTDTQTGHVWEANLPVPGAMVEASDPFHPAIIRGLTVYPENPLQFDFIIDTGDDNLSGTALQAESQKLIKYFLATLTTPENELWVNLSPNEKNRIIPDGLGTTEMGRDMLAQDYLLKQLTATLIYPERDLGRKFWDQVYKKADKEFGISQLSVNTFNKVWIVPDKATVYEHQGSVFVVERHLKVMLEEDMPENMNKHSPSLLKRGLGGVVREVILPAIEQEVNYGKNFAPVRQIYNSMILATWYKKHLKEGLLGKVYVNQNKVRGIDLKDTKTKERIYNQYFAAFQKGVYNYIKEDLDENSGEVIARKYFSGGITAPRVVELPQLGSSVVVVKPESKNGHDVDVAVSLEERRAANNHTPTQVVLVGLGSPAHYNMWNNLSLETLQGDIEGQFAGQVKVATKSSNNFDEMKGLVDLILQNPPAILGLSVQPGSLELVKEFVRQINSDSRFDSKKTLLVFGNQLPTYFPQTFLDLYPAGIVVRGEGEFSLRGLVQYARQELRLEEIPNLVFIDHNNASAHTQLETADLEKLEHIPNTESYGDIIKRGGNVLVQSSRGCPWGGCAYCTRTSFRKGGPIVEKGSANSWRGFPVSRVLATLDAIMAQGITEAEFADDEFFGGRDVQHRQRIYEIADGIEKLSKKHNMQFSFRIFTRPNTIFRKANNDKNNEEMERLLLRLKEVGLVKIFVGVEGGNQTQFVRYRRGMHFEDSMFAIDLCRKLGIGLDIGFIMFDPFVTVSEMLENVKFFRENKLMKYNQWPFRPLVVNEGALIVNALEQKGLLGASNPNYMAYNFTYADPAIDTIQKTIDSLGTMTKTIFYAMKVKSKKYFDEQKQDDESRVAQHYVEANGYVYLDLMERLGQLSLKGASADEIEAARSVAEESIKFLLLQIANDVGVGKISDDDNFLKKELAKIGVAIKDDQVVVTSKELFDLSPQSPVLANSENTTQSSSSVNTVGGINFNPVNLDLQIKRDDQGVPLPFAQQPIENIKIDGFSPVIINISPVSVPQLLGISTGFQTVSPNPS